MDLRFFFLFVLVFFCFFLVDEEILEERTANDKSLTGINILKTQIQPLEETAPPGKEALLDSTPDLQNFIWWWTVC